MRWYALKVLAPLGSLGLPWCRGAGSREKAARPGQCLRASSSAVTAVAEGHCAGQMLPPPSVGCPPLSAIRAISVSRKSPVLGMRYLSAPPDILPTSTHRRQHPLSLSTAAVDSADARVCWSHGPLVNRCPHHAMYFSCCILSEQIRNILQMSSGCI